MIQQCLFPVVLVDSKVLDKQEKNPGSATRSYSHSVTFIDACIIRCVVKSAELRGTDFPPLQGDTNRLLKGLCILVLNDDHLYIAISSWTTVHLSYTDPRVSTTLLFPFKPLSDRQQQTLYPSNPITDLCAAGWLSVWRLRVPCYMALGIQNPTVAE
ncbi:hypothetical protein F2P79_000059 [Pimephales promelas]|nr:hypothetical protein F2P79_000059 [Pimephales promelas]